MATEYASDHLHSVDEAYFSALLAVEEEAVGRDGHDAFPADAQYAEGLQFQEALMGSVIISQMRSDEPSPSSPRKLIMAAPCTDIIAVEAVGGGEDGGSGESSQSFCEICVERKENDEMFRSSSCVHSYCLDCVGKHVVTKIHDNIGTIACPGLDCKTVLELEACRPMLPKGVIDLWEETLSQAFIDASQRFYCPYKDCSEMMIDDAGWGEIIRESECPFCHRLFCAQCRIPWHAGVECEEYQMLNEGERGREDLMVMELARDKKWARCPRCRFYVERIEGCPHMTCRCQFQFCYGCSKEWNQNHGGCNPN